MKRATVGPLPGVTQDIAGYKVILFIHPMMKLPWTFDYQKPVLC